jgi:UV DNA damage endonuclease
VGQAAKKAAEASAKKEDGDGTFRPDPDGNDKVLKEINTVREEAQRPPPVNSDYLSLPWKGRLGYVSLPQKMRGCY